MNSFDRTMPEELNRVIADHASDLLLCSTRTSCTTSGREGAREAHLVGDVMADVSLAFRDIAEERSRALRSRRSSPAATAPDRAPGGQRGPPERLGRLVELIEALPAPLVFPLHPRTRCAPRRAGLLDRLRAVPTWSWRRRSATSTSASSLRHARAVLTDSGGVPEGGLPARRPLRDAARSHRVGGDGRGGWNALVDLDAGAAVAPWRIHPAGAPRALRRPRQSPVRDVVAAYTARL